MMVLVVLLLTVVVLNAISLGYQMGRRRTDAETLRALEDLRDAAAALRRRGDDA